MYTLVKSPRIYTGQYTFRILLLNDDNMLGEHKEREKTIVLIYILNNAQAIIFDTLKIQFITKEVKGYR